MAEPVSFVIFGASGDLSRRKLIPALYHLYKKNRLPQEFKIFGVATRPWSEEDFRTVSHDSLKELNNITVDEASWNEFAKRLTYQSGNFKADATYQSIAQMMKSARHTLL